MRHDNKNKVRVLDKGLGIRYKRGNLTQTLLLSWEIAQQLTFSEFANFVVVRNSVVISEPPKSGVSFPEGLVFLWEL